MKKLVGISLISFFIFISACSSDSSTVEKTTPAEDSTTTLSDITSDTSDLHIFTLPAPLQVVTILKMSNQKYNEKLLIPSKKRLPLFSSNYNRAFNLGMYTIDLSYATVYNQSQTSIDYAKHIETLTHDLGLSSGMTKEVLDRFEVNINKQDSLYKIILQTYSAANKYFQENNREGVGMYILTGCYVEGLYITLNLKEASSNSILSNLVGQQKIFLENIIELIQYTESTPETFELLQELNRLYEEFKPVKVEFLDTKEGRISVSCYISAPKLKSLIETTLKLRNKFISG